MIGSSDAPLERYKACLEVTYIKMVGFRVMNLSTPLHSCYMNVMQLLQGLSNMAIAFQYNHKKRDKS